MSWSFLLNAVAEQGFVPIASAPKHSLKEASNFLVSVLDCSPDLVDTRILDDVTITEPNTAAVGAYAGIILLLDRRQLVPLYRLIERRKNDSEVCRIELSGVAEAFSINYWGPAGECSMILETLEGARQFEKAGDMQLIEERGFAVGANLKGADWPSVERAVFDLLGYFLGVNYLDWEGDEPELSVFRVRAR